MYIAVMTHVVIGYRKHVHKLCPPHPKYLSRWFIWGVAVARSLAAAATTDLRDAVAEDLRL